MFTPKEICGIIMLVVLIATFLTIFFFTYASTVEGEIVEDQVDYIVNDFTKDLKLLPPNVLAILKSGMKMVNKPDLTTQDKEVEEHNNKIITTTIKYVAILFIATVVIIYYASNKYNFTVGDLIKQNLIILVFIALTEFCFLNLFARQFISANPNLVKKIILNNLTK